MNNGLANLFKTLRASLTFVLLTFSLTACSLTQRAERYAHNHGQPDAIKDSSGEIARYYLPGKDVPSWKIHKVTLYYLTNKCAVVFRDAKHHIRNMSETEIEIVKRLNTE